MVPAVAVLVALWPESSDFASHNCVGMVSAAVFAPTNPLCSRHDMRISLHKSTNSYSCRNKPASGKCLRSEAIIAKPRGPWDPAVNHDCVTTCTYAGGRKRDYTSERSID